MIHTLVRWSSLIATVVLVDYGCTSYENKLIGTWIPANRKGEHISSREISFFTDHRVVSYGPNGKEQAQDSITYELIDDSHRIRFKTKSGETKDMIILELTDSNLTFYPEEERRDTLRFVRE